MKTFDVRAYYDQLISSDIGNVARDILGSSIIDEQKSTLFIDCPHHSSTSHRSFHIWLDKQGWYCHGCGTGGDVLQLVEFVQSGIVTRGHSGVMPDSHKVARDWLAEKNGLPLLGQVGLSPEEIKKLEQTRAQTMRAWECLTETTKFYNIKLLKNTKVLTWIFEQYSFDEKIIKDFLIGYADNSGLIEHLTNRGFTLREITSSGVFRPDNNNEELVHPTFIGRVIFPYMSKGRVIFMIARKTPWTPDNKYEAGKYKKLPIYDFKKRPWINKEIDNSTLFNEDILTNKPEYVIITEGITDCISLIHRGFPVISPVTVNIRHDDWSRIIPKLQGVKKVILCQDNEISEAGWQGALRSANRLLKENITCRVAQLPLFEEQTESRCALKKFGIFAGIEPKILKQIRNEKTENEQIEIAGLIEKSKIDICSFFVSGKTEEDFQKIIDSALLPVEFAIKSLPDDFSTSDNLGTLHSILIEIGRQPKPEQDKLLKVLQEKVKEKIGSLRGEMKEAVRNASVESREKTKQKIERKFGAPIFKKGNRSFFLVNNTIVEQFVRETPQGPIVTSQEISNFHIKIVKEEISDDGEVKTDGSTISGKLFIGKVIAENWERDFRIDSDFWGNNNRLSAAISAQAGIQAMFSTRDIDMIRIVSAAVCGIPERLTIFSIFGVHPQIGFVTPTLTISKGKIIPTDETQAAVKVSPAYQKAQRLDLESSTIEETKDVIEHLLTDHLDLQPHKVTMPLLSHAFLGPLLFGMDLVGEFSPYVLFLVGSSGKGKTETAKLAQSIWGNFQLKEHLASWGSTPEINRQEAARCRGALWIIDDFKRAKIGNSQWNNAIRVLLDYADLQARKRATPGSKVISGYAMKCMLLITGEDIPTSETALLARSLMVEFHGRKDVDRFRKCLHRQNDYRKIPAHYIAWLQKQDSKDWRKRIRGFFDGFNSFIDEKNLDIDNSRRLASNAALSASGFCAFLDFSESIGAIDRDTVDKLFLEYWGILTDILENMLVEVEEVKPVRIFISALTELIRTKKVAILSSEKDTTYDTRVPIIGYRKDFGDTLCLFPKTTMGLVREHFRRGEDESLNFSTTAIGKQLAVDGYLIKPPNENRLTFVERVPGGGAGRSPERVWRLDMTKIEGLAGWIE